MKEMLFRSSKDVDRLIEEFSELVAECYPDIHKLLHDVLQFILNVTDKTEGIIFIGRSFDSKPYYSVFHNITDDYKNLIEQSVNDLLAFAISSTDTDKIKKLNAEKTGTLYALPLLCCSENYGFIIFLTPTDKNNFLEDFLVKAGGVIGRVLKMWYRFPCLNDRVDSLNKYFKQLLTSIDNDQNLNQVQLKIAHALIKAFQCQAVVLAFFDVNNRSVLIKKTLTQDDDDWRYHANLEVSRGIIGEAMINQVTVLSDEPVNHPTYDKSIDNVPGKSIDAVLCVPIIVGNSILGAVELINFDKGKFSITEQKLLETVSNSIASIFYYLEIKNHINVLDADKEAILWELSRSRNTLRSLFDNMPTSVYIIDQEYKLVAANLARSVRADKDPSELIGLHCYVALFQRSTPCPGCLVGDTLFRKIVTRRKLRVKGANEEITEWDIDTYPITNDKGQVIQAILIEQDVTESRRLEGILAQSEKMAAVGQLAAGLAHEINNPLTVILANTQILMRELPKNEDWEESLDLINLAGTRALQVVRNLLGVSRKEEYELALIDINENIQRALDLIRHEVVVRSVTLNFDKGNDLPLILASSDHLQGVWLNIVLNALDAIEPQPGGMINIATNLMDDHVHITITDNGSGISPDRLKRIFEPFYTTKEPGRGTGGTGLGLSVSYRIVKQHGGDIFVNSEIDKGTTFTVVLPTGEKSLAHETNSASNDLL